MQGMDELEETSLPAPVDKVWSLEREEVRGITRTHVHMYTWTHTDVHMYTWTHTHTHTHTYTHPLTHTDIKIYSV